MNSPDGWELVMLVVVVPLILALPVLGGRIGYLAAKRGGDGTAKRVLWAIAGVFFWWVFIPCWLIAKLIDAILGPKKAKL